MTKRRWLGVCFSLVLGPALAASLKIDTGHGVQTLESGALLRRADARDITVPEDVSYHRSMTWRAVPLRALLGDLPADAHIQFTALDGFSAEIPLKDITNTKGAQAWLAIEQPSEPWPPLKPGKPGAGPFYLVWTNPKAAGIGPEEWPYQIAAIRLLPDPATRFPAMRPDAALPADSAAVRGFAVFQRHCIACHTLNGQGDARLGPDLNQPHNPTEYFRDDMLRTLIRQPSQLRHWPEGKMPGFSPDTLSDADLDLLLAYLRQMAAQRKP
nr:c-type cytochrome [Luteibacter sp. Sphag1AF]